MNSFIFNQMEALQETHEYTYSQIEFREFKLVPYNIPFFLAQQKPVAKKNSNLIETRRSATTSHPPLPPQLLPSHSNIALNFCGSGVAVTVMVEVVGRRGTKQLHLLEQYLDVLAKHTTEIPPPTALAEGSALSALVEGVSLR